MQVKISQAVRMITAAIKAKVVPMLKGSPGTGKSQIVYQIAESYNLAVIDIRLSQCDPTDLAGFPTIEGGKADYMPMKHFPIEGDPLPRDKDGKPMNGWLLFLDESTSAPPAIQAAAYKLVLDRMVGSHRLHKQVAMVLAGNLETDGAIVHPMSTALQSRLLHLELVVDANEWIDWAITKGIDHRITSFIKFKPGNLYTFQADHTDCTYSCPRTLEFADRILKVTEDSSPDRLPLLAGTVSEGVARELITFCKIYADLPTTEAIIAAPDSIKVPAEPSILFALTGSIAHNISLDNAGALVKYITRLPVEFQVVCLRETVRRNKAMMASPPIQKWIAESAANLF
jgi:hypothetical protein